MIIIKNKRAQLAIFIVLALLVVAVLALYFLWSGPTTPKIPIDPEAYISECVRDSAEDAVSIIMKNGGDLEPELTIMYYGENVTYLCYNHGNYKPCINQRPMLIEHIEKEIKDYIEPEIRNCFSSLKKELEGKDYSVTMGSMDVEPDLQPKRLVIDVNRELTISKSGQTDHYKK